MKNTYFCGNEAFSTNTEQPGMMKQRTSVEFGYGFFMGGREDNTPRTRFFRSVAILTATAMLWLSGPQLAFAKGHPKPKPYSVLKPGLTQTPDAKLRAKIAEREAKENNKPRPAIRNLSQAEKQAVIGRGPYRNKYFTGTMPWQRSLKDVNIANGNLFKSFTDIEIKPARGAGMVLQRTYNSNDDTVGPFGIGWTHAYDIRVEDAPETAPELDSNGNEIVPRKDFFGGKHKYTRDADGLYTPPAYLFDEMDSEYADFLVNGPTRVLEDEQRGMDGTVKHFIPEGNDANGRPSRVRVCNWIKDRHGNTTTLTYNAPITLPDGSTKKLLQKVTDPSGRELNFTWSNLGTTQQPAYRIVEVVGPTGTYRVTYDYNAEKNLSAVHLDADGLNRTTTYGYTSVTGSNGTETGLLSSITDPLGQQLTYQYDLLPYYNPTGTVWVTRTGEPSGEENGVPRSTPYYWYISPGYWYNGELTVSFSNREIEPGYVPTPYAVFDGNLRLKRMGGGSDGWAIFNFTYGDTHNPYSVTQDWRRDGAVVVVGTNIGAYQHTTNYTYGPHGNVLTQQTTGYSGVTTTEYYNASKYFQKKKVTDPLGRVTEIDYFDNQDANPGNRGQVKWVRDARYGTTGKQFEYAYNAYGQKVWEKSLNNVITTFEYNDTWGNLTKVIQDPDATGYTGLKRTTTMVYDIAGKVTSSTDPNGQTSTFNYNKLGQPTSAVFPTSLQGVAGETISYTYGGNGRTETVTDGRGTTSITYESGCNRVKSVTDPQTGTLSYKYNLDGLRKQMTMPNNDTVTYTYTDSNPFAFLLPKDDPNSLTFRLTKIEDSAGRRVEPIYTDNHPDGVGAGGYTSWLGVAKAIRFNQTFDGSGQLVAYNEMRDLFDRVAVNGGSTYVNTRWLLVQRDTRRWTKNQQGVWQSQIQAKNVYTYNDSGQRTQNQITDHLGNTRTETYGFDELYRLTSVNYGDGQTQGYTFDDMGNRLTKTDNVAGNDTLTHNAANMLLTRNGGSYTNDANGNTLTGGGRVNTWDAQNRLTQVVFNTKTSAMTYGSGGLRRKMLVTLESGDQTETSYILDGSNVVQESVRQKPSAGSWTTPTLVTYLLGPDGPMYRRPANVADVRWYLYDGLGSVIGEVDPNGTITAGKKHDVYGATRSTTGAPLSKHGWVGVSGHTSDDETGLVYMRARHYDPVVGRFISQDPAKHGANWFAYCRNNPINRVDPTGKTDLWLLIADLITKLLGDVPHEALKKASPEALGFYIDSVIDEIDEAIRHHRREAGKYFMEAKTREAYKEASGLEDPKIAECWLKGDNELTQVIFLICGKRALQAYKEML